MRKFLGLKSIKSFSDITDNKETISRLNKAYNSNVNNCDLWVGIISKDPVPGGVLGEVGVAVVR